MEKVQRFLQFLFPDLPRHETCWRSPPLPLGLCAVAAGSSVSPGPLLSWRKEVAQGLAQGQLWEPGGATLTPLQKSTGEVRHLLGIVVMVESLWICSACFSHSFTICRSKVVMGRDVLSWRKEKHQRGRQWKVLFHGDGHFLV